MNRINDIVDKIGFAESALCVRAIAYAEAAKNISINIDNIYRVICTQATYL